MRSRPFHASAPKSKAADTPAAGAWRDGAFWSLILACLAAFLVLTALDDRGLLRVMAALTTHGKTTQIESFQEIALIIENIHWWILALPVAALLIRWLPLPGERPRRAEPAESAGVDNGTRSDRRASALPCPAWAVGLFALQLCIGAGFLGGVWTDISDRFWATDETQDQIRNELLPEGALPVSRRLARILPPDAKVYLLTDPGEASIFLNYYLYPRRLYSSETEGGFVGDEANKPSFWAARRKQGYRWVFLYRPHVDPVGGGQLIELLPSGGTDHGPGPTTSTHGEAPAEP